MKSFNKRNKTRNGTGKSNKNFSTDNSRNMNNTFKSNTRRKWKMTDINSPYYCRDIEKAVQHPLWTPEEQAGLISRHNERTADKSAGKFLIKSEK